MKLPVRRCRQLSRRLPTIIQDITFCLHSCKIAQKRLGMFLEDKNAFNALRGIIELLLQDQLLRKTPIGQPKRKFIHSC